MKCSTEKFTIYVSKTSMQGIEFLILKSNEQNLHVGIEIKPDDPDATERKLKEELTRFCRNKRPVYDYFKIKFSDEYSITGRFQGQDKTKTCDCKMNLPVTHSERLLILDAITNVR